MEHRQVEPLFVLLSLLALVACASRLVPSSVQQPNETGVAELEPTPVSPIVPAIWRKTGEALPAACLAPDASTTSYVNVEDGYCLRYPAGFRLGEALPGIANVYGPPRAPGAEPLAAGLVARVTEWAAAPALDEAVAAYVQEQAYAGGLGPDHARTEITLGGEPAVLLEGPGEDTPLYVLLAVRDGKRYTLSIWPDPQLYPLVAADVAALRETVRASFSFLPAGAADPIRPVREEATDRTDWGRGLVANRPAE